MVVVEDSTIILLAKRIRIMLAVSPLSKEEIREVIMDPGARSDRIVPNEIEFNLAYRAAVILNAAPSPNGWEPAPEGTVCLSCDDKGCGFCVTGDSLAAHFPKD